MTEKRIIELYTDGACINNPGGPGGWGAVLVENGEQKELSGGVPSTTNNRMEITAVIKGLEHTPLGASVTVCSDSQYVVNTMTKSWARNKNTDLWDELDQLVHEREVQWEWVRGHAGHPLNELADRLSVAGVAEAAHVPVEWVTRDGGMLRIKRGAATANKGGQSPRPAEPISSRITSPASRLTHVDQSGKARMVDVGGKEVTEREAVAKGAVIMQPATLRKIRDNAFEKGDVLGVARVAGVMAAKKTHELIPLCHPVPLNQIAVDIDPHSAEDRVEITATARATWKTGVEMEALTAVIVAALTVYDMCKAADRGMRIENVRLVRKTGGKSGDYVGD